MRHEVILGQWCRAVIAGLVQGGVTDIVISPGSRSTPLVVAALRVPNLRCHSRLDERSAGFFALGLARATDRPVALLCTSGSACAHYLPALMEAWHSEFPLLALTADRPLRLQDCGAPQTAHQEGIFGRYAISSERISEADEKLSTMREAHQTVLGAVRAAKLQRCPVHVNLHIEKPLETHPASTQEECILQERLDDLLASEYEETRLSAPPAKDLSDLESFLGDGKRTAIVVGAPAHALATLTRRVAKRYSSLQLSELGGANFEGQLERWMLVPEEAPERLLQVGQPPVGNAYGKFIEVVKPCLWTLPGQRFATGGLPAERVILGAPQQLLRLLAPAGSTPSQVEPAPPAPSNEAQPSRPSGADSPPDETGILKVVLEECPRRSSLFLANSLSIRLATWAETEPKATRVFTARGLNGIDGSLATANGIAEGTREPVVLVVGDVALAHDLSSLAGARTSEAPIVVVLIDNDGGRIFDHLPAKGSMGLSEREWDFWRTPPQLDWEAAARTFGARYEAPKDLAELSSALRRGLEGRGAALLHVRTDPNATLEQRRARAR